jgi:hypothetical protein
MISCSNFLKTKKNQVYKSLGFSLVKEIVEKPNENSLQGKFIIEFYLFAIVLFRSRYTICYQLIDKQKNFYHQ